MSPAATTDVPPDPLVGSRVAVALADGAARARLAAELESAGASVRPVQDAAELLLDVDGGPLHVLVGGLSSSRLDGPTLCRALRDRFGEALSVMSVGDEDPRAGSDAHLLVPTTDRVRAALRACRRAARETRREPPAAAHEEPVPPCSFAGHELLGVLGRGSYGVVYEARRPSDGRVVALKLLAPEVGQDRTLLARFLREVQALSAVRSPHVVRALGMGRAEGRYFIVMERAPGRPAPAALGADGPCDVAAVVRLARDMCAAIEALQRAGITHRDIKPENILVDERGRATLVDLGLARRPDDLEATASIDVVGTLPYIAPELLEGRPADAGSELYALGVTLWELLTGRAPFAGRNAAQLMASIAAGPPVPEVRRVRPDVPPSLSWLVARLMDRDPARRLRHPRVARRAFGVIGWACGPAPESHRQDTRSWRRDRSCA